MNFKRIFALLGFVLPLVTAEAQEYWLPSRELIEQARREPVITDFIRLYEKEFTGTRFMGFDMIEVKCEVRPDGIHTSHQCKVRDKIYNYDSMSGVATYETNLSYNPKGWAKDRKEYDSALCLKRDGGALYSSPSGNLCDAWFSWFFYITGYTFYDKWTFSNWYLVKPRGVDETVVTRPKEIADAAIAMYNLPDWSRSSQIALLSRTMSTRFESFWDRQNYKTLIASKYSEVSAMSEKGIVVRAGVLDPAQFDRISEHGDEAVAYIYQDNPLIVIAARTLGIPLDIYLYDLTRLGTKSNLLIQPESL